MDFTAITGFKDILPSEIEPWQRLEAVARDIFRVFGFQEIKLPAMERTELFSRSIGQETDIVSKEMYTLHGRQLDLQKTEHPEDIAGHGLQALPGLDLRRENVLESRDRGKIH